MNRPATIRLPRHDVTASVGLLSRLATGLDVTEVSAAHALDEHADLNGAVDQVPTTASLHAEALHARLTPAESPKAETTR